MSERLLTSAVSSAFLIGAMSLQGCSQEAPTVEMPLASTNPEQSDRSFTEITDDLSVEHITRLDAIRLGDYGLAGYKYGLAVALTTDEQDSGLFAEGASGKKYDDVIAFGESVTAGSAGNFSRAFTAQKEMDVTAVASETVLKDGKNISSLQVMYYNPDQNLFGNNGVTPDEMIRFFKDERTSFGFFTFVDGSKLQCNVDAERNGSRISILNDTKCLIPIESSDQLISEVVDPLGMSDSSS